MIAGELIETAAALWPGADVVPAGHAADGRPVRARYAVLSRSRVPTALVPVESAAAAGGSLRRFSTASSWWDSTARAAAAVAVRAAPGLLRHRVEIRGGEDGLAEHLSAVLGEPVTFSVSIGTERVNRKPVLQVFDESGRCLAFAKVGWSDTTVMDVLAEGRALDQVADHTFRHLVAPEVLARTTWRGRPVLVASPLLPSAWSGRRRSWTPPESAMNELDERFSQGEVEVAGSEWWSRRWELAGEVQDPVSRSRLERAMEAVPRIAGARPVRFGAWHGDWTPWNMAFDGRAVLLWDWERFEVGVPSGIDALHYVVNALNAGVPASADGIIWALKLASYRDRSLGGEPHVRSLLYLIEILCRYLRLTELPGGRHITARAMYTLVALERLTGLG